MATPGWVYLAYDAAGRLLYVGSTDEPAKRLRQHRWRSAAWWPQMARVETVECQDRLTAYKREAALIRELEPVYNQLGGKVKIIKTPRAARVLTPEELARDERIVRLRAAGWTTRQISREFGVHEKAIGRRVKFLLATGRTPQRPRGAAALPPDQRRRRRRSA